MYKFLILIIATFCFGAAFGQYKPVNNTAAFKTQFATASAHIGSVSSDFVQVKSLTALSDKLTSKGKFYFQKDNKVRMQYHSPFAYLMVINGSKILVKDGDKTTTLSAKSGKTFQRINQLMMDCMNGNIFNNKDFSIRVFEDADTWLAEMTPVTAQMKGMFSKVNVIMKKKSFVVQQVQLFEPSGDYTSINYSNLKLNEKLSDALFAVK